MQVCSKFAELVSFNGCPLNDSVILTYDYIYAWLVNWSYDNFWKASEYPFGKLYDIHSIDRVMFLKASVKFRRVWVAELVVGRRPKDLDIWSAALAWSGSAYVVDI